MIRRFAPVVIFAVVVALSPCEVRACSTFCLGRNGGMVIGKNYDFGIGYGMLVVNKRGVAKTSQAGAPNRPAAWTSRYGSLTFNQFGREFPSGGMNEAGLAVELMWLDAARYPSADARPAVGVLEWIQYQLDNFATAAEVVANAEKVRIASRTPLHYLVADAGGGCATIEFLDGRLVARSGPTLPVRVLTNDTYDRSLAFARGRERRGDPDLPPGSGSLERFARAAALVKAAEQSSPRSSRSSHSSGSAVADAFRVLDNVANAGWTQWSIAWDLAGRRVHFKTLANPKVRSVALASFDLSCKTPVRTADVDAEPVFSDYSRAANRALIERSFRGVDFLRDTPASEVDATAADPETTTCVR